MSAQDASDGAAQVRRSFAQQPFMHTIGGMLEHVGEGRTSIRLELTQPLTQQHGFMHAGALITILDTACGYAALSLATEPSEVLTAELKVNLLRPVACAAVIAEGRVLKAGRKLTVCQGDAYDADDRSRHLATILATMVLAPRED